MKDMADINAIIFDFVGVLLHKKRDYKPNKIADKIDSVIGSVTNDKIFKKDLLNKHAISEKELDYYFNVIARKYEQFEPLWELIPVLKKNFKLAIINNGTAYTLPYYEKKYNLNYHFDFFVSSALVHMKKPDKEIYIHTAGLLEEQPQKCLFIDDSVDNIKTAKLLGFHTIHWKNKNKGIENFINFLNSQTLTNLKESSYLEQENF